MISLLMTSVSTVSANLPRRKAAARLTMGVSSRHNLPYRFRSSARKCAGARGYAVANTPQADTRDVNQSVVASRCKPHTPSHCDCCAGQVKATSILANQHL